MPRSPLTEILERVEGMVTYVRENLNPDEYDLFLDKIAPQPLPEVKKPQKKAGKKEGEKRNIQKCDIDGCGLTKRAAIHKDATMRGFHAFLAPQPAKKSARASGMAKALNDNLSQRRQEVLDGITGESTAHTPDGLCTNCVYVFGHNVHHLPSVEGYHEFQPQPTEQAVVTRGGD